jgi:hypothetical protein
LVFDVFNVNPARVATPADADEIEDVPAFRLRDGRTLRRAFRVTAKSRIDQCHQIEVYYYILDLEGRTNRIVQNFPLLYYYRFEIEHLLARAGFRVTGLYGDFDGSPLTDESPEMIFIAGS